MLFNSFTYAIFLPLVFAFYWSINRLGIRWQNAFILLVSYIFYGWWDWRFLVLIAFSSAADYCIGLQLNTETKPLARKYWLWLSLALNLGLLGFFKYFNFFTASFAKVLNTIGLESNPLTLNIILPVGISFYTFQTLSYTIDVYKGRLKAEANPITFMAYVSFFPQLVAGPIERARHLLPQFNTRRKFDYYLAKEGLQQILWGLAKKILVADQLSYFVTESYISYSSLNGSTLLLATAAFFLQIYCDFSGYSDIAIGTAKLFGIRLTTNFWSPLFAISSTSFWQKWHISLLSWLRDYLFKPLGGSRGSKVKTYRNILIVFTLSGFWHGPHWNFIIWGFYFGLVLILERYIIFESKTYLLLKKTLSKNVLHFFGWLLTIFFTTLGLVWFRAENFHQAGAIYDRIFSVTLLQKPDWPIFTAPLYTFFSLICLIGFLGRNNNYGLKTTNKWPTPFRWVLYLVLVYAIIFLPVKVAPYIYFQF